MEFKKRYHRYAKEYHMAKMRIIKRGCYNVEFMETAYASPKDLLNMKMIGGNKTVECDKYWKDNIKNIRENSKMFGLPDTEIVDYSKFKKGILIFQDKSNKKYEVEIVPFYLIDEADDRIDFSWYNSMFKGAADMVLPIAELNRKLKEVMPDVFGSPGIQKLEDNKNYVKTLLEFYFICMTKSIGIIDFRYDKDGVELTEMMGIKKIKKLKN